MKQTKTKKKINRGKVQKGIAHIHATYNNTIVTITDLNGNVLVWSSAGASGFKGTKKSTQFAATKMAQVAAEKVRKFGMEEISVLIKGIGSGRDSAVRGLVNNGLVVNVIKDITPLPHNGCKPKKVRRV